MILDEKPGRLQVNWRQEASAWLLALVLVLPAGLPYFAHFVLVSDGQPTGFIQLEQPYYLANAREHFDQGRFQLTYGNPYSPRYQTRSIYFQPQTLMLGLAWKVTGASPGLVFAAFGFLAAWVCVRVMIGLYRASVISSVARDSVLGVVLFAWGGGLLAITGYFHAWLKTPGVVFENFLDFDPFGGWWFLNLGRNLVMPTEAYYHALFLSAVLAVFYGRYRMALVLALLTSLSHPFTGIELGLILAGWAALERLYLNNLNVPRRFLVGCLALVVTHLGYYLVYLNRFEEHRILSQQWALAWTLDLSAMVPAYAVVGVLAAWRLRRLDLAKAFLSEPRRRLLLVWFAVAFLLSNHEILTKPVQPLHFTRGYIWTPLFLLGADVLFAVFTRVKAILGRVPGTVIVGLISALFLLDNALWLGSFPIQAARGKPIGDVRLDPRKQALFRWMEKQPHQAGGPGEVVLCRGGYLSYLMGTYTPLRTWRGHGANTPRPEQRGAELTAFYEQGVWLPVWDRLPLLVVVDGQETQATLTAIRQRDARLVYDSEPYRVYRVEPERRRIARAAGGQIW